MPTPPTASPSGGPPPKRYLRNYLLDARFQLKLTAYAVGATLIVVGLLGGFLWTTTQQLFRETQAAVDARSKAAETSKELGNAALSNTLLEHFNDPAFEKQLREQSQAIDAKYEEEKAAIVAQYDQLRRQQRATLWALVGGLLGFVAFVAFGAIVTTHKIVGPLFRFKRMAQEIAHGELRVPSFGLRQGDEFKDFFQMMTQALVYLRDRETDDLNRIGQAIEQGERAGLDMGALKELQVLKRKRLDS